MKQWIVPLKRTRKLAESRELQKTLIELYPAPLLRQKLKGIATNSKMSKRG